MQLADVVSLADDIGPASRGRAEQILVEARWLERLLRAYQSVDAAVDDRAPPRPPERARIDLVAAGVVKAMARAATTSVTIAADEAWTYADSLSLWRAMRNVVDNAVRAAGPAGRVHVQVSSRAGWSVAVVDDDGPGFGDGSEAERAGVGLGVVGDFAAAYGGRLELGQGGFGGGGVRILLPAATPPSVGVAWTRVEEAGCQ
ncbi:MAG TPA: ATP-binding protein [Planosporangium sp.]|nr:ATP-binding protein [Planosporangium sp.]